MEGAKLIVWVQDMCCNNSFFDCTQSMDWAHANFFGDFISFLFRLAKQLFGLEPLKAAIVEDSS